MCAVCRPSPRSSTKTTWFLSQNATLSRAVWSMSPRKRSVRTPLPADGFDCVSLKMAPKPPNWEPACVAASVSPVASKKNSLNCLPGRNCPFSGRLNGVASFALASALASKGVVPWAGVVDQHPGRVELVAVGVEVLLVLRQDVPVHVVGVEDDRIAGRDVSRQTWSAWSLPPWSGRACRSAGSGR